MPTPRHHLEVMAVNNKIYAIGGRQGLDTIGVGYTDVVKNTTRRATPGLHREPGCPLLAKI